MADLLSETLTCKSAWRAVVVVLLCSCSLACSRQPSDEVSKATLRAIERDLSAHEKEPIEIDSAVIVRTEWARPFVCGFYDTKAYRRAGMVTTFMWREGEGLIPGAAHDNHYACMERLTTPLTAEGNKAAGQPR